MDVDEVIKNFKGKGVTLKPNRSLSITIQIKKMAM